MRKLASKLTGPVPYLLEAAIVLELATGMVAESIIVAALVVVNGVLQLAGLVLTDEGLPTWSRPSRPLGASTGGCSPTP